MHFTPCERITELASNQISLSVFEFLSFDYGSAIFLESTGNELFIEHCLFRFCISANEGGAIYAQIKHFKISKTCFDNCNTKNLMNDIFGNSIFAISDTSKDTYAYMNYASFILCGPELSTSGDSAAYFRGFPFQFSNLNFSKCHSLNGASSLAISDAAGKSSFIDIVEGTSLHISCLFNTATIRFSQSNFIDWKQSSASLIFYTQAGCIAAFEQCCIFLSSPDSALGNVAFLWGCYGNVGGNISRTISTAFPLSKVRADDYCNLFSEACNNIVSFYPNHIVHTCICPLLMKVNSTKYLVFDTYKR